jgi:hypothetical protein
LTEKGQKAARQRKSTMDKKERTLTLNLGVVAEGRGDDDDDNVDE